MEDCGCQEKCPNCECHDKRLLERKIEKLEPQPRLVSISLVKHVPGLTQPMKEEE